MTVATDAERVYAGSEVGLHALDRITGQEVWRFANGNAVWSSPAVVDGVVYVGSWDGHVYALDAASGTEVWSFATGGEVDSSTAVVDRVVYVGSKDGHVYAIHAASGTEVCVLRDRRLGLLLAGGGRGGGLRRQLGRPRLRPRCREWHRGCGPSLPGVRLPPRRRWCLGWSTLAVRTDSSTRWRLARWRRQGWRPSSGRRGPTERWIRGRPGDMARGGIGAVQNVFGQTAVAAETVWLPFTMVEPCKPDWIEIGLVDLHEPDTSGGPARHLL